MKIRVFCTLLLMIISQQVFAACLPYEPAIVTVAGKLTKETHPGSPNYEDISKGDAEETGFYLILSTPICTAGANLGSEESFSSFSQENVTKVQLVLDSAGYDELQKHLNKEVNLQGTLFSAHTGRHHASVLISNVKLVENN
ncbi:MAG: DUF4431 domain-containing protein [Pseudomonadales bacterium]